MTDIPQILKEARQAMDKAVDSSRREFGSIRSGKASVSLLDTVRVDAYGQTMSLTQVATVSAPEPRMLTVTPWDKGLANAIEKAIRDSDLGLNPASHGQLIRVPIPALNEERRRELVKVVHKLAEEGRIAIRHARTDARERLKKVEHVSDDAKKHAEKDIQKIHDDHMQKLEEAVKGKEAEIMEV